MRSGLIAKVQASLTQAGLEQDTFGGIHPNPRLFQVREGVEKAKAMNADFILAVGGGSVIDASKAIALGVANPEADEAQTAAAEDFLAFLQSEACLAAYEEYCFIVSQ